MGLKQIVKGGQGRGLHFAKLSFERFVLNPQHVYQAIAAFEGKALQVALVSQGAQSIAKVQDGLALLLRSAEESLASQKDRVALREELSQQVVA